MREKITRYIRAGYAGLYLVSPEEQRVEAELKTITDDLNYQLYAWSVTTGLMDTRTGTSRGCQDPMEAVSILAELPENTVVLLRDFQPFLDDPNPVIIRQVKDQLRTGKLQGKTIVMLGCRLKLPPELEREFTVLDFALPDASALQKVLSGIVESTGKSHPDELSSAALIDAARGLTTTEAEDAFALSVIEAGGLSPVVVAREKAQAVRKNGLLELVETNESLASIGGLDQLKDWLLRRREAFTPRAVEYGLPAPKGVLMLGVPGCGKSLSAKATASVFGIPLLRLDAGRIFAGLVGQSEANLRSVIQTAEAIAPCVLWLDELEKAFAGSKRSGSTDGGTASRVFGAFISWMQEKLSPVFIVATANDVSQLPPEMLRKGRWDELFFVDLPTREEREAIWVILIQKFGRDPAAFDLRQMAKITEGFTGSEIEQVFIDALYRGFDQDQEPTDLTIGQVLVDFVPLSKLMGERMTELRTWATGRARPATTLQSTRAHRKIAA